MLEFKADVNLMCGGNPMEVPPPLDLPHPAINHVNNRSDTALINASYEGSPELCKILIRAAADIHHENKEKNTALNLSADFGHYSGMGRGFHLVL